MNALIHLITETGLVVDLIFILSIICIALLFIKEEK